VDPTAEAAIRAGDAPSAYSGSRPSIASPATDDAASGNTRNRRSSPASVEALDWIWLKLIFFREWVNRAARSAESCGRPSFL
jgi:hypothetical protein